MKPAVVVVAFNSAGVLPRCLASVVGADDVSDVVVVDNCSPDDSAEVAARAGARVVRAADNRGFGAGCNLGVEATNAGAVMFLNPDAAAGPGTVDGLARHLESHPRAAVVASSVRHPSGRPEPVRRRFPSVARAALEPGLAARLDERWYRRHARGRPQVDWVVAAAMLVRRTAFDAVGGFDESFFLYCEELDLCARLCDAGWEVHWVDGFPSSHESGTATRTLPGAGKVAWAEGFMRATRRHQRHPSLIRASVVLGLGGRAVAWRVLGKRARSRDWASAARSALAG